MRAIPIKQQVKNGVKFLDKQVPGWRGRIRPETLDVQLNGSCILGQLFRNYGVGLIKLKILNVERIKYGFCTSLLARHRKLSQESLKRRDRERYHELTAEWKRVLAS